MTEELKNYPVLPLRDTVMFPHMVVPLFVGRKKTIAALNHAQENDQEIFLVAQKNPEVESPKKKDLFEYGCVAKILQILKIPDGTVKILVEGKCRARLNTFSSKGHFYSATLEMFGEKESLDLNEAEPLLRSLSHDFDEYTNYCDIITSDMLISLRGLDDPGRFTDAIAMHLPLVVEDKQIVLEELDIGLRVEMLLGFLQREIEWSKVEKKIQDKVKDQIKNDQTKYYNLKKLEAFKKELSEDGEYSEMDEISDLEKSLLSLNLTKEVKDKVLSELSKLKQMAPMSAEATVVRSYLDWIVDLPWGKMNPSTFSIKEAEDKLNTDHYGLEEVKDRILEFLAVQLRVKKVKGPILCLVGPPGVGKTSLGRSIANAMDREFVRISLGGVRDESEIRGHRKTYIGAMPGRIIKAMKKAKVSNPVILLDEIDKMGADYRGDPASALLEVLDPEQNSMFNDHYLEVDYDLSNVIFITTANTLNMHPALRDRLEIIRIPGYTELEKINIAKSFLWEKSTDAVGILEGETSISDAAITDIIRYYTRESGVRSLERALAKICRKAVKNDLSDDKSSSINISARSIEKYLGVRQYKFGIVEESNQIGIVRGMAWTEVGGELLTIEVVVLPGKGKTLYTGSLGDVMKESIQAANSVVRSRASALHIEGKFYQDQDIHVHVPEGATPKDGPSAGIGMCVALVSALTKVPVKACFAMTGEVTLRGEVLEIGGLKEKLLAALRGGITDVIIPEDNKKDLKEIPKEVLAAIDIHTVQWIDQVLDLALDIRHKHPTIKKKDSGHVVKNKVSRARSSAQKDTR
ncbi:MAG: endopeptidase La [Legionellales bacterium]|jgi:ATP-dependent Lon protease|nr:endopeptidase La [Legionellales bacterium]